MEDADRACIDYRRFSYVAGFSCAAVNMPANIQKRFFCDNVLANGFAAQAVAAGGNDDDSFGR